MKIKSLEFDNIRIVLTQKDTDFIIERFENNKVTNYKKMNDYDFASEVFDYFAEMEFDHDQLA